MKGRREDRWGKRERADLRCGLGFGFEREQDEGLFHDVDLEEGEEEEEGGGSGG